MGLTCDNETSRRGAGNTTTALTHLSDDAGRGLAMEATHITALYADPCPRCQVRAMTSTDGHTATCQNCRQTTPAAELIIRRAWTGALIDSLTLQRTEPVVYYIRFGDRVKIGTTTNLKTRLTAIPHDEVLATEPGSYDLEKQRHRQFRAARIYANREWFHLTDELRMHIAGLCG